jgi:hypothetical protein
MSVTEQQPTEVGQRVQEIFADTRGLVVELGERDGEKVAVVKWDEPNEHDEDVFPVDALRVVKAIQLDLDLYEDPATHPMVEYSYCGAGRRTHYVLKGGEVIKGRDLMRAWLLGYHTR